MGDSALERIDSFPYRDRVAGAIRPRRADVEWRNLIVVDTGNIHYHSVAGGLEDAMRTQIGKWGNSLALRLPKDIAEKMRIEDGTTVDLEVAEGVLKVVTSRPRYSLDELVKAIRRDNIPDEIFDDGAKGRELI